MRSEERGFQYGQQIFRLLWNPDIPIFIHRPDLPPCDGSCLIAACLNEDQLALLKQLVGIPLQLQYGPFNRAKVEELYLALFGDEFTATP
jgi:hypothetical protein